MKNLVSNLMLFLLINTTATLQAKQSRLLYHISANESIKVIDNQSRLSFIHSQHRHKSLTFDSLLTSSQLRQPNIYSLLYSTDTYMLIGTYERLLNISFNDLKVDTTRNQVIWRSRPNSGNECEAKVKNADDKLMYLCSNYIRGVVEVNKRLVVCGTNGSVPFCRRYYEGGELSDEFQQPQLSSLKRVTNNNYMDVDETAPFAHEDAVYFVNSGSYTLEPTINKLPNWGSLEIRSNPLARLVTTPKGALKNAKFRGSFASADKVYFIFYETESAMDYKSGLTFKTQYSFIGEVCDNDSGKPSYLETFNRFITFKKASIYCYLPDYKEGFHVKYTEIQAVSAPLNINGSVETFYAIFTFRRLNSIDSALCQFKMSAVTETMTGYFKSMDHDDRITYKQPLSSCQAYKEMSDGDLNKYYQERTQNYNYQMETTVNEPAIFAMNGARFTAIVIDTPSQRNNFNKVIFIGLSNGRVIKLLTMPVETKKRIYQQPIVVQEYQILEHGQAINSLIVTKQGKLIAVSDETIRSVDLDVACLEEHLNCSSCLKNQDPYCAWSTAQSKCVSLLVGKTAVSLQQELVRDFRQCLNPEEIEYTMHTLNSDDLSARQHTVESMTTENRTGNLLVYILVTAVLTCLASVGLTCLIINKRNQMSEYLSRHLSTTFSFSTTSYNNNNSSPKLSSGQEFYMPTKPLLSHSLTRGKAADHTKPLTTVNTNLIDCQQQYSPSSDLLLSSNSSQPINDTLSWSNESCCFTGHHRECDRYSRQSSPVLNGKVHGRQV